MILVSSHLGMGAYLKHSDDMVYRINMAWRANKNDIRYDIAHLPGPVFLDNPEGRSKPPNHRYTPDEVVELWKEFPEKVLYIAVSNVEWPDQLEYYRENTDAIIVPKIETVLGVANVVDICDAVEDRWVMLDHDDLIADMRSKEFPIDNLYEDTIGPMLDKCKENNIKVLRTAGVVFSER